MNKYMNDESRIIVDIMCETNLGRSSNSSNSSSIGSINKSRCTGRAI